jgi:hypothetical protein
VDTAACEETFVVPPFGGKPFSASGTPPRSEAHAGIEQPNGPSKCYDKGEPVGTDKHRANNEYVSEKQDKRLIS